MNRRVAIHSGLLAGLGSTALAVAPSQAADAQEGDQARGGCRATRYRQHAAAAGGEVSTRIGRWCGGCRSSSGRSSSRRTTTPSIIEVGARVWEGLIEWHVREEQTLNVTRAADGRYVMAFMFTNAAAAPGSRRQLRQHRVR